MDASHSISTEEIRSKTCAMETTWPRTQDTSMNQHSKENTTSEQLELDCSLPPLMNTSVTAGDGGASPSLSTVSSERDVDSKAPEPTHQDPCRGGFTAEEFSRYEQMLSMLEPSPEVTFPDISQHARKDIEKCEDLSLDDTLVEDPMEYMLPEKRQIRSVRMLRHTVLNVYRRLFSLVLIGNIIALIWALHDVRDFESFRNLNGSHFATAAASNILVATVIRQDYIINALYRTAWLVPRALPIKLRCMIAKVYEFGGIHSACGVCGTIWFILFSVWESANFWTSTRFPSSIAQLTISYTLVLSLLAILVFAYPFIRFTRHNLFEKSHRFLGWFAVALFWILVILQAASNGATFNNARQTALSLVKEPSFWLLIVITFHLILPWLYLRRWTFTAEPLSTHALRLRFPQRLSPFVGIAISDSPLMEWHPFATFPALNSEIASTSSTSSTDSALEKPQPHGGSLIISISGDWTRRIATAHQPTSSTSATPPTHPEFWVRGLPRAGVLSTCVLFSRIVIVTTGSGIGPCLGVMLDAKRLRAVSVRVLWSAPSPLKIYGPSIVNAVRDVDSRAVIIDTRASARNSVGTTVTDGSVAGGRERGGLERKRPDMLRLAYGLFRASEAEAVFVISNPRMTRKVVYGLESRGVPCFGPIWDS